MITFLQTLIQPRYLYRTEIERQRARALLLISYIALVIQTAVTIQNFVISGNPRPLLIVSAVLTYTLLGGLILLIHSGRLQIAIWAFIGAGLLLLTPFALEPGLNLNFILVMIPVVAAGALLDRRGFVVVVTLSVVLLGVRVVTQNELTSSVRVTPAELLQTNVSNLIAVFAVVGVLLFLFSGSAERIARISTEDVDHLRRINAFTSDPALHVAITGREGEEVALMQAALRLLETDLGYSLTQIYLLSSAGITRRVRSSAVADSGGFVLTENESEFIRQAAALPVTEQRLALNATGALLRLNATDSLETARYLTPPARTAVLFPLRFEGRTLGVLEIQSADLNAFTTNRLAALGGLVDMLAVVTNYAQNLSGLQTTISDQQRILGRVRSQLADAQQRSERLVTEGWRQYLENRGGMRQGVGYDIGLPTDDPLAARAAQPIPASDLPPEIRDALRRGEVVVETSGDEQIVKAPILLRDEILGAMVFRIPADRPITDRQVEMVRTVANRLAVALENNRLFEQSQSQAQRERKANQIAGELLKATNVEALMTLAAERFNDALGAVYTRISLQPGALAEAPLSEDGLSNGSNGSSHSSEPHGQSG